LLRRWRAITRRGRPSFAWPSACALVQVGRAGSRRPRRWPAGRHDVAWSEAAATACRRRPAPAPGPGETDATFAPPPADAAPGVVVDDRTPRQVTAQHRAVDVRKQHRVRLVLLGRAIPR
jgi:hypothetical protein